MTGRGGGGGRKTLLAPIHFIFSLLQKRSTVSIWLYENLRTRIEGKIRVGVCAQSLKGLFRLTDMQGFDEFMNLVIDDAVEVQLATRDGPEKRRQLGKTWAELHDTIFLLIRVRTNIAERRQCFAYTIIGLSKMRTLLLGAKQPRSLFGPTQRAREPSREPGKVHIEMEFDAQHSDLSYYHLIDFPIGVVYGDVLSR